jgi:hypothetical protein
MILTDNDGNKAPKILSDWLFQNDCYNQSTNKYAVATREEVYTKWSLPGSPKSDVKKYRFSLISILKRLWNKIINLFR